jgi:DNA-binding transcriptional ArsR family regulator
LPITNWPPQITAVVVAKSAPVVAPRRWAVATAIGGINAASAAFISIVIEEVASGPRYLPMPLRSAVALEHVLDALADPIRLRIVRELATVEESPCGALTVPVSESTRSHHLRTLREAGVTRTRVVGTQRLVSLRRDELDLLFPGLLDVVIAAAGASR